MTTSAPFAEIFTIPNDPRIMKARIAASMNNLTLSFPEFQYSARNNTDSRDAVFHSRFPLGKFPAMVTSDGFTVVESGAIAYFLAASGPARSQLLGPNEDVKTCARIQQWELHAHLEIMKPVGEGASYLFTGGAFDAEKDADARKRLARVLDYAEKTLGSSNNTWIAGTKDLSLADLSVATALYVTWSMWIGKDGVAGWGSYEKLTKWFDRVREYKGCNGEMNNFAYKE